MSDRPFTLVRLAALAGCSFGARRSAVGRSAVGRAAPAEHRAQVALALALGGGEGRALGVDCLGVEHGPFARRVGCREVDAVFTHARDVLRERGLARFCVQAAAAGDAPAPAATALLQRFLVLGLADARWRLKAAAGAACRAISRRRRRQRDALFPQAGSQRREAARSRFRSRRAGRWRARAGGRRGRRAACGASARRQRNACADYREGQRCPDAAAARGVCGARWMHGLFRSFDGVGLV